LSAEADGLVVRSLAVTFRAGTEIQEHRHGWGQLIYVSSGAMRVSLNDSVWMTPPTRALWIPAGIPHRLRATDGEVALRTLYIAQCRAAELPSLPMVVEVAPLLRELVLHIVATGMLSPSNLSHDRLAGLLVELINSAPRADMQLSLPRDPRALRLAERLLNQPGERSQLDTLSAATGASLRTLQRLFRRETGLSIDAWRHKARLVYAALQLANGASVTEAGLDAGWQSAAAFVTAFRQAFGITPGRYARR